LPPPPNLSISLYSKIKNTHEPTCLRFLINADAYMHRLYPPMVETDVIKNRFTKLQSVTIVVVKTMVEILFYY